ncbi:MAG: MBL fold metallo-hydrolase [Promethearchaeota archaeon]
MKNMHKFVKVGFTNCYLLECNSGYLLIDTGYPHHYEKFVSKLKRKYNIHITEIRYLLLTHHHDDHAGFAAELLKNSKAKLLLHEKALKRLELGTTEEEGKPVNFRLKIVLKIFSIFHEFSYPPIITSKNHIILKDFEVNKDLLRNIGIDGTILYTPGHTKDGISVILKDGSVFPGDNTMNSWYFNIFGIKKRPIYIQDIGLIFNSWKRYIEFGGKFVYPAHGKPFDIKYLIKYLKEN